MANVVGAFGRVEPLEEAADGLPEVLDGPLGGVAQQLFELGERQFDRVQVRAVGRQEEQGRARAFDCSRTPVILCELRLSSTTMSPGVRTGTSNCSV